MESKSILTQKQSAFLDKIGHNDFFVKNFYLTGGTALSAYYLKHRISDDLDFFSVNPIIEVLIIIFSELAKSPPIMLILYFFAAEFIPL